MFHEKIAFYRKKNLMTQEDLAEHLCVSRQTVTKWESGMISPSIDYLIDLSEIFGVTIDSLIKEDDCTSNHINEIEPDALISFLVKAKKETYAGNKHKLPSLRKSSHDYMYENGTYTYYDSFFGSSSFSGQELVYCNSNVCWSMNYYGKVLSEEFNGNFLKEALLQVNEILPMRGRELYQKGEYIYCCRVYGTVSMFYGEEEIYYQEKKIYTCKFHGGTIQD